MWLEYLLLFYKSVHFQTPSSLSFLKRKVNSEKWKVKSYSSLFSLLFSLTFCPLLFFEIKNPGKFYIILKAYSLNLAFIIMCVSLPSLSPKKQAKANWKPWYGPRGQSRRTARIPERNRACQHVHRHRFLTILAWRWGGSGFRCKKVLWQGWGASWGEMLI